MDTGTERGMERVSVSAYRPLDRVKGSIFGRYSPPRARQIGHRDCIRAVSEVKPPPFALNYLKMSGGDGKEKAMQVPIEIEISPEVRATVGFADDRVEIKVWVILKWVTLSMEREAMGKVDQVQEAQKAWLALPEAVRREKGAR